MPEADRWLPKLKRNTVLLLLTGSIVLIAIYLFIEHWSGRLQGGLSSVLLGVAGSLFAAAIFSLALKAMEDLQDQTIVDSISALGKSVGAVPVSMESLVARVFANDLVSLCKFHNSKTPTDRLQIIQRSAGERIHFTAMGINLHPFTRMLKEIAKYKRATIHLLLPNPDSAVLVELCKREGRDLNSVRLEIQSLLEMFKSTEINSNVVVRWTDSPSGITIVRIGDIIFWRPRLHKELEKDEHFCLEINDMTSPMFFRIMKRELGSSWDDAGTTVLERASTGA